MFSPGDRVKFKCVYVPIFTSPTIGRKISSWLTVYRCYVRIREPLCKHIYIYIWTHVYRLLWKVGSSLSVSHGKPVREKSGEMRVGICAEFRAISVSTVSFSGQPEFRSD